jgi:hypothetical protein
MLPSTNLEERACDTGRRVEEGELGTFRVANGLLEGPCALFDGVVSGRGQPLERCLFPE